MEGIVSGDAEERRAASGCPRYQRVQCSVWSEPEASSLRRVVSLSVTVCLTLGGIIGRDGSTANDLCVSGDMAPIASHRQAAATLVSSETRAHAHAYSLLLAACRTSDLSALFADSDSDLCATTNDTYFVLQGPESKVGAFEVTVCSRNLKLEDSTTV